MKLSARVRYAARILLELARQNSDTPVAANTLAQRTDISVQFIEQILKPLKQAGITASLRGVSGGHMLQRPPAAISLGDIMRAMEGSIHLSSCTKDEKTCPRWDRCLTRGAWASVSVALEQALDSFSLEDLLTGNHNLPGGLSALAND